MGTLVKKKWGHNGDPKSEKGPHGDPGPQMGTQLGAVIIVIKIIFIITIFITTYGVQLQRLPLS